MDVELLRVFREVAEQKSFTRAAEVFNLNQSSISHRVAALEAELNCKLIVRGRPRSTLTPEGRRLLELAGPLLDQLDSLYAAFDVKSEARRRLRLSTTTIGATYLFASVCQDFIRQHPGVDLIVRGTADPTETIADLLAERADVALTIFSGSAQPLASVSLGHSNRILVAGAEFDVEPAIEVDHLADLPFVVNRLDPFSHPPFVELFAGLSRQPEIVLRSTDMEFMKRMVAIGLGVAILPAFAVRRELDSGELRYVEIVGKRLQIEYGIMYLPQRFAEPVKTFVDFCLEHRMVLQRLAAYP